MRTCPLPRAEWGSPCSALWKHSVHISVPFVTICVIAALRIRPSQERWCVLHVPLPLPLPWQTLFPTLFTTEPRHRLRILLNTALDNHSQQTAVCTQSEVCVTSPKEDSAFFQHMGRLPSITTQLLNETEMGFSLFFRGFFLILHEVLVF